MKVVAFRENYSTNALIWLCTAKRSRRSRKKSQVLKESNIFSRRFYVVIMSESFMFARRGIIFEKKSARNAGKLLRKMFPSIYHHRSLSFYRIKIVFLISFHNTDRMFNFVFQKLIPSCDETFHQLNDERNFILQIVISNVFLIKLSIELYN